MKRQTKIQSRWDLSSMEENGNNNTMAVIHDWTFLSKQYGCFSYMLPSMFSDKIFLNVILQKKIYKYGAHFFFFFLSIMVFSAVFTTPEVTQWRFSANNTAPLSLSFSLRRHKLATTPPDFQHTCSLIQQEGKPHYSIVYKMHDLWLLCIPKRLKYLLQRLPFCLFHKLLDIVTNNCLFVWLFHQMFIINPYGCSINYTNYSYVHYFLLVTRSWKFFLKKKKRY